MTKTNQDTTCPTCKGPVIKHEALSPTLKPAYRSTAAEQLAVYKQWADADKIELAAIEQQLADKERTIGDLYKAREMTLSEWSEKAQENEFLRGAVICGDDLKVDSYIRVCRELTAANAVVEIVKELRHAWRIHADFETDGAFEQSAIVSEEIKMIEQKLYEAIDKLQGGKP